MKANSVCACLLVLLVGYPASAEDIKLTGQPSWFSLGGEVYREREIAEADQPAIIFGDSFGNEEAVRAVAADYPDIPFVFGSGGGPAEPNFSVFDNWIHEPAYLAGWLAGGLTKSNTIGVVAGYPVPEVNRITNAFIEGARATGVRGMLGIGRLGSILGSSIGGLLLSLGWGFEHIFIVLAVPASIAAIAIMVNRLAVTNTNQ